MKKLNLTAIVYDLNELDYDSYMTAIKDVKNTYLRHRGIEKDVAYLVEHSGILPDWVDAYPDNYNVVPGRLLSIEYYVKWDKLYHEIKKEFKDVPEDNWKYYEEFCEMIQINSEKTGFDINSDKKSIDLIDEDYIKKMRDWIYDRMDIEVNDWNDGLLMGILKSIVYYMAEKLEPADKQIREIFLKNFYPAPNAVEDLAATHNLQFFKNGHLFVAKDYFRVKEEAF